MWAPTTEEKYGVAIYNFESKKKECLDLEIGDAVQIVEQCQGWYRGLKFHNKTKKGIFPASYISVRPCTVDHSGTFETVVPSQDPTVRELTFVIREWHIIWKQYHLKSENMKFFTLQREIYDLLDYRKNLLSETLTNDQVRDLKCEATSAVNNINQRHNLDLIPWKEGEPVDPETISPVELYSILKKASQLPRTMSSLRPTMKVVGSHRHSGLFSHHILLTIKSFPFTLEEETETYFSIYSTSGTQSKFISERFVIRRNKSGHAVDKSLPQSALFVDLNNADMEQELYLVAHLHRIGRLLQKDKEKKNLPSDYRRPFACAILSLKDLLLSGNQQETSRHSMKLQMLEREGDFSQLHETLIRKHNIKSGAAGQFDQGLVVELKKYGGNLDHVKKTDPFLLNTKNVAETRKLGFPDIILPGDVRNDLYITLNSGEFNERDKKTTGKNVEVLLSVIDQAGNLMKGTICHGTGRSAMLDEYRTFVYYHSNSPQWLETIKVSVPMEKFPECHIRFEFRHCSNTNPSTTRKPFSFSFMRLADFDGTIVKDSSYELVLYKCEDVSKLKDVGYYLKNLVSYMTEEKIDARYTDNHSLLKRNPRDKCFIETKLCSTKLTQNRDLLNLLQWRNHPKDVLKILDKLHNLPTLEIVKLLQDILDALFSMFSEDSARQNSHHIFQSLVYIFELLTDKKYEHFQTVMTTYLEHHFSASLVYKDLLECIKSKIETISKAGNQEQLQSIFKVLEYIFKFVVRSMDLFRQTPGVGNVQEEFKQQLTSVISSMQGALNLNVPNNPQIARTQVILLDHFSKTFDDLMIVLPQKDLAQMISTLLGNMREQLNPDVSRTKLQCLHTSIANQKLFSDPGARNALLPVCMGQLKHFFIHRTQLDLCASILSDVLLALHEHVDDSKDHIKKLVMALVDPVLTTVKAMDMCRISYPLGEMVSNFISMLKLMDESHYKDMLSGYPSEDMLKTFLIQMLVVFQGLVKKEIFPAGWRDMRMVTNGVILNTTQYLSQTLTDTFRTYFEKQLWSQYFHLAVQFVTQPSLQLESLPKAKQERILERYNDMRVPMGYETVSMWESLGDKKIFFIPVMVGRFLELTMVPQSEVREATLPVFYDMMECEYSYQGNFKQVESELIDKLDILIGENKGDQEYTKLFNIKLLEKVKSKSSYLGLDAERFVNSVTKLLERLMDYRNVTSLDDEMNVKDKKMTCTMNLLNFYKSDINRKEMHIRYIYKLADLHLSVHNYTEAAFTLVCHAEMLNWTNEVLPAERYGLYDYEIEAEWKRKEKLYDRIIEYFDKGKTWEYAIPYCKELVQLYETKLYDYKKLSGLLKTEARFYSHILDEVRLESEFYRVGFYGMTFPSFIRNKIFVYRGLPLEKLGTFRQRLQAEYPGSKVMSTNSLPEDSITEGDQQYIQICNVKPMSKEILIDGFRSPTNKIKSFYKFNDVDCFTYDRPFHDGVKDSKNEFKTLCLERTHLQTVNKLPGILRWFEVSRLDIQKLSPIETAIDTMTIKNEELKGVVDKYKTNQEQNLNPLTMRLNGIIDAAVNGGISNYQEAFFTSDFAIENPECAGDIVDLKQLFLYQIKLLEQALNIHGKLAPDNVKPLHDRLVELFADMKSGFDDQGSPDARNMSLPRNMPVPVPTAGELLLPDISDESAKSSSSVSPVSSLSSRSSIYNEVTGSSEESLNLPRGRPATFRSARPKLLGSLPNVQRHMSLTFKDVKITKHLNDKSTSDSNLAVKAKEKEGLRQSPGIERRLTHAAFPSQQPPPLSPKMHRQFSTPHIHANVNTTPLRPAPPIPRRANTPDAKNDDNMLKNGNRSSTTSSGSTSSDPEIPNKGISTTSSGSTSSDPEIPNKGIQESADSVPPELPKKLDRKISKGVISPGIMPPLPPRASVVKLKPLPKPPEEYDDQLDTERALSVSCEPDPSPLVPSSSDIENETVEELTNVEDNTETPGEKRALSVHERISLLNYKSTTKVPPLPAKPVQKRQKNTLSGSSLSDKSSTTSTDSGVGVMTDPPPLPSRTSPQKPITPETPPIPKREQVSNAADSDSDSPRPRPEPRPFPRNNSSLSDTKM